MKGGDSGVIYSNFATVGGTFTERNLRGRENIVRVDLIIKKSRKKHGELGLLDFSSKRCNTSSSDYVFYQYSPEVKEFMTYQQFVPNQCRRTWSDCLPSSFSPSSIPAGPAAASPGSLVSPPPVDISLLLRELCYAN
jgi:hypothetical protein